MFQNICLSIMAIDNARGGIDVDISRDDTIVKELNIVITIKSGIQIMNLARYNITGPMLIWA